MDALPRVHRAQVKSLHSLDREAFWKLVLTWPEQDYVPGQFVMVRPLSWSLDPVLPRPFSIADVDQGGLHLYFQIVGRGTKLLSHLRPGQEVDVWGPLGTGFVLEQDRPTLLLAGGMGIVPFVGLARRYHRQLDLELIFGHRVPLSCYPFVDVSSLIKSEAHQQETMEEIREFVTYLGTRMAGFLPHGQILACGPEPFLKAVQEKALASGVEAQLSMERRMACGVGGCLGCVVEKEGEGLVQSCTRGPVFRAEDIVL